MKRIKHLKEQLETISEKDLDVLSKEYDPEKLTKKQVSWILDVSCYLLGKDTYTEKEIKPYMSQANTWFILEKLRREGLVRIDNKGIVHKTRLGKKVDEYLQQQS